MAKFNKRVGNGVTADLLSAASNVLTANESSLRDPGLVSHLVGVEGFSDGTQRDLTQTAVTDQFQHNIASLNLGLESFTQAQLEAGSIIAMAKGNPEVYAAAAMRTDFPALESRDFDASMIVAGAHGSQDTDANAVGLEYFNETTLDKHMAASLIFNVQAARQNDFSESFFPTITIDPSECGLLIEIQKTMVYRGVRHAMHDKDSQSYQRRNILDAATDYTVLEDRSIEFIPYMNEDGTNAGNFIPEAVIAPQSVQVNNYFVRTNPLLFNGADKNLLRLSAHPGLVTSGVLDESDEFDGRVALSELLFAIKKKGEGDDKAKVLRQKTVNLARASFNKSQEGDGREMTLDFRGNTFTLHAGTVDISNAPIPALQDIVAGEYKVKFSVQVHATFNLQTGLETAMAGTVRIEALVDADGKVVDVTTGAGKALVDAFEIKAYGYNYKATRSNSNRRNKGLLLDNVTERERYKITLGSPITSRKPVGRTDNSQSLNDLITAARMRNDNLAITKLLNYTEVLKDATAAITNPYDVVTIEGAGRHYIRPWYDEAEFDVQSRVAALQSTDVADALREALLIQLRDQVTRAYQESRFQPALEMLSGYTQTKPKVIIGTDIVTANWLWEKGDLRTLGDAFEYKIVTTNDMRFYGRIQWCYSVGNGNYSPLNFGNMLWVPELITDTNLTRNDAVANELTVQPRNYHVVNCPITGVVNVKGLHDYLQGRPSIGVQLTESLGGLITDAVMDGLTATTTP